VKERRKPARSGKAQGTVAGSHRASGKGRTCRWKAPRIGQAARVDARAVETILALRRSLATGGCGARQGASEAGSPVLRAAENAAPGKRRSRAGLVISSLKGGTQAGRPKLVKRRQALIHLGSDCRKVVWRRVRMASGLTLRLILEAVVAAQAASLGVERFSGARIECRLQRSVRSIFPASSR